MELKGLCRQILSIITFLFVDVKCFFFFISDDFFYLFVTYFLFDNIFFQHLLNPFFICRFLLGQDISDWNRMTDSAVVFRKPNTTG